MFAIRERLYVHPAFHTGMTHFTAITQAKSWGARAPTHAHSHTAGELLRWS